MRGRSAESTHGDSLDNDTQTKLLDMRKTCFNSRQENRRKRLLCARKVRYGKTSAGKGTVSRGRSSEDRPANGAVLNQARCKRSPCSGVGRTKIQSRLRDTSLYRPLPM